jgi:hypothetical protein
VLFGQEMKENLYHRVIDACQLEPDIKILPGGDMTEIGEKVSAVFTVSVNVNKELPLLGYYL